LLCAVTPTTVIFSQEGIRRETTKLRRIFLYMTMTLDGFLAGPNNELSWMVQTEDQELNKDIIAVIASADSGILGFPTASGMIPYWSNVAKDPSASKNERDLARVINKIHSIVVSKKKEKVDWDNSELLVVKDDAGLVKAVNKLKQLPGKDIGVPGGVRTAQTLSRLGLIDEYILMVHPVAIGAGKRLFTEKADLELISMKAYRSGIIQVRYRPRRSK
jgi:dihydrofolate reductase